jgi:hypothetical protein
MKKVVRFFDVLEDRIRSYLSHYPLLYALIGGVGVVLFWRGIWHTVDEYFYLSGPTSAILGVMILGLTGVLVSSLIGTKLIIAGLRGDKKVEEKTQKEIVEEGSKIDNLQHTLEHIESEIQEIRDEVKLKS